MKTVAVCIASRGAPVSLEMTLRVLQNLESGKNKIDYVIGVDPDDFHTIANIENGFFDPNIILSIGNTAPLTLGEVWNRCASRVEADIYFPLGDDAHCLTQNWDEILVQGMRDFPAASGLAYYNDREPIFPVVTKAWLKACGHLSIDLFPYWFTDTWTQELYEFATGDKMPIFGDLCFGGKKGKTRNMRELKFWWGVFNATRTIRFRDAKRIVKELGLLTPNENEVRQRIAEATARDKSMLPVFEKVEQNISTEVLHDEPPERYINSKFRAEAYLAAHDLKPWCNLNGFVE